MMTSESAPSELMQCESESAKCNVKALQQNVMQCILMQSKDSVRRGAQRSYDDEKRPVGFVYSLQWPLNEGGVEHKY